MPRPRRRASRGASSTADRPSRRNGSRSSSDASAGPSKDPVPEPPKPPPVDCGICLDEIGAKEPGLLDCCEHSFCFECITEWSHRENSCPLCKRAFTTITKRLPSGAKTRPVRVESKRQDVPAYYYEGLGPTMHHMYSSDDEDYSSSDEGFDPADWGWLGSRWMTFRGLSESDSEDAWVRLNYAGADSDDEDDDDDDDRERDESLEDADMHHWPRLPFAEGSGHQAGRFAHSPAASPGPRTSPPPWETYDEYFAWQRQRLQQDLERQQAFSQEMQQLQRRQQEHAEAFRQTMTEQMQHWYRVMQQQAQHRHLQQQQQQLLQQQQHQQQAQLTPQQAWQQQQQQQMQAWQHQQQLQAWQHQQMQMQQMQQHHQPPLYPMMQPPMPSQNVPVMYAAPPFVPPFAQPPSVPYSTPMWVAPPAPAAAGPAGGWLPVAHPPIPPDGPYFCPMRGYSPYG